MSVSRWTMASALVLLGVAATTRADELEMFCTISRGHIVEVRVHHEDQKPAQGVKVSLVAVGEKENKIIQVGKINADGEWSWPAPGPGNYEIVVDPGTGEKDITRIPVEVKPAALPSPEPDPDRAKCDNCPPPAPPRPETPTAEPTDLWLPGGIALGVVGAFALMIYLGRLWGTPTGAA